MRLPRLLAHVLLALMLGHALPAEAQDAGRRDARARRHFEAGTSYMESEDYESALREFNQAYKLSPRPALLFNVGVAASKLDRFVEAIDAFEAFVASGAAAEREAEVQTRLTDLKERQRAQQAAEEAATPQAVEVAETGNAEREREPEPDPQQAQAVVEPSGRGGFLPWVTVGAGVALAGVGGTFLALGLQDVAEVEEASVGTAWSDVAEANDRAATRTGTGVALLAVGVAAAAGGVLWWALGSDDGSEVALSPAPNGLRLRGKF